MAPTNRNRLNISFSPPISLYTMSTTSSHKAINNKRKRQAVVADADQAELERHYKFVLPSNDRAASGFSSTVPPTTSSSWQERMVRHYHQHLYKEYVIADLSFAAEQKLGLRWRTEQDVAVGKGSVTCGNKHCPSYDITITSSRSTTIETNKLHAAITANAPVSKAEAAERLRLMSELKYGDDQMDYEVPFTYSEGDDQSKTELVKLRLCAKCAPLLFLSKSSKDPCLAARGILGARNTDEDASVSTTSTDESDKGRKRRVKKRKKRHKKKHRR
jgi:hypothetical protein